MPSISKPNARDFYLRNVIPRFSTRTYEEYVLQTSLAKGRMKAPLGDDLLSYYRNHPLAALQYSNSIEIDYVCRNIIEIAPALTPFISQCFVGVSVETDIHAAAFYASTSYNGRIIEIDPGLPNWLEFFLAPFVALSWAIDSETPARIKDELESLLASHLKALAYLRANNSVHADINRLQLPYFPLDEMWLERTYYKQAALAFVLLHEIGHHVLSHADVSYLSLVTADVRDYAPLINSDNHKIEFEADYFAARTLAKWVVSSKQADHGLNNDSMVNGFLLGPLLTFIALCHLSDSFERDSSTHPSNLRRLSTYIDFYRTHFTAFNIGYGLYITRIYSELLFGDTSSILSAWEPWWENERKRDA